MTRPYNWGALVASALISVVISGCGSSSGGSADPEVTPITQEDSEVMNHLRLGDQYRTSGLPDQAVGEYEEALALDEENLERVRPLLEAEPEPVEEADSAEGGEAVQSP